MDSDIKDKLLFPRKDASVFMGREDIKAADEYCKAYISFLNTAKTEREAVSAAVALAEKEGFIPWKKGMKIKSGDKVYFSRRGKAVVFCTIGKKSFASGLSIVASHIDSPRLDLKMQPLYEDSGMAFFDTHYYGNVKPYQWTGIPLALHGFIVREDGRELAIQIGEKPDDPRFFIADLLPHLAEEQMKKPVKDAVPAENLDVLAGLNAAPGESGTGAVKLNILRLLYEKYGITEKDLVSAELSVVPAFSASELGLDRSMVGAYGQDDKVCAYPGLTAFLSVKEPEYAACLVLADKEETGSLGISGMQSAFFPNFINELAEAAGESANAREVFSNSFCVSADVNASWYPLYKEAFDKYGDAKLNHGVILFRYWGQRGKENTNDADAQTVAALIKILDEADILWQTGEGGKVDAGSSGTLSRFFTSLDVPSIDLGVPLLSMHSPFEGAAKADIYMAHRAFTAFFKRN
ncbi:MAG: aminopeptidase [Spirochaetaceae bacterium]|jgi:aspartyl aminopeptidase|nr:aminopeptidase [Spirochaetaceae bacterium]